MWVPRFGRSGNIFKMVKTANIGGKFRLFEEYNGFANPSSLIEGIDNCARSKFISG